MKTLKIGLIALCFCVSLAAQTTQQPVKIILKLDDFPSHPVKCNINKEVMDFLVEKNVKASFGLIAGFLNDSSSAILRPYLKLKAKDKTALFEFWHHGLLHEKFPELTPAEQKKRFEKADSLVRKKLGIQMHTFGAPFNSSDSVTIKVISENSNYKVLMFVNPKSSVNNKIMYLNNRVNMENGTGKPEFDFFVDNFNKAIAKNMPLMILQGHPNQYTTPEKLEQFKKIVQFLIDQKIQFTTPYEFYLENNKDK